MSSDPNAHEKSIPLTFGSIISLSSLTDTDSFVYVDGFVQDKILSKNFKANDPKLIYSKSLFQIYPPLINTNKKRALDIKTQQKVRSKDFSEQKKAELVTELQDSILTEFKINLENFKKVAGQSISFEQPIQFLHVASNKFLSCRKTEAQLERQNYKVGLDEYSNDNTVFRFLPCYKHQKDSEASIFVTDSLYIASVNNILDKVPYLHISNPISVNAKKEKLDVFQRKRGNKILNPTATKEIQKKKTKIEVNISLESSTRLKINYYSNYLESENSYLECGDTVWLNHSELAATLVCMTEFTDNQFKFKIQFDGNRVSDHFKQFIGNTNGMWVIENVKYQNGGFIQWNESYRFKHLGSGFYLTVKKIRQKNQQEAEYRIVLESELSEDNEFMFIPVPSTLPKSSIHRQYVTKDTFVLLMHKKTRFIIHGNFEKNELKKNAIGEDASSSFLGEVKPSLKKYGEVSEQAAFKIIQANYNEVWETNFLISCFPVLKSFLNKTIMANQKGAVDKFVIDDVLKKLDSALRCIKNLDQFCNNRLFNNSPDQKYGEVNAFRQKLLKEQFFIDILVMILKESVSKNELELYENYKKHQEQNGGIPLTKIARVDTLLSTEGVEKAINKRPILGDYARRELEPQKMDNYKLEQENLRYIEKKIKLCHSIYSLLKNICKNNYENEIYTYNLIPQFLIQCKYIPEAVECVMSIIQENNYILNKLNENIKMNIDDKLAQESNIIKVIINLKDEADEALTPQEVRDGMNPEEKKLKISKPINLINFFLNLLREKNQKNTNAHFLTFFRNICRRNKVGLSVNQDLLFKIFTLNPKFIRSFTISFDFHDDKIQVEYPTNWAEGNIKHSLSEYYMDQSSQGVTNIQFLEEQLLLFSDLALSRNYLWKTYLENRFPYTTVFNTIWDQNFPKSLRAAMCTLALTVYVDHEPFNELNLPRMCRIYDSSELNSLEGSAFNFKGLFQKGKSSNPVAVSPKVRNIEVSEKTEMESSFLKLIDNISEYLKNETEEMNSELIRATEERNRKDRKKSQVAIFSQLNPQKNGVNDCLNDELLLNVVQLYSKLISFDMLKITGRQSLLYQVVSTFTKILEYDPKYPSYSYLLAKYRKANVDKRIENIKKKDLISISGFKNVMGSVVDNFTEITGTLGDLLNITQQNIENEKGSAIEEIDEQNTYNNPTMRSMLSLHYYLERLKYEEDERKTKADIKVKLEICDTMDFLINMRKNYLISNYLAWYQKLGLKMEKYIETEKFDQKLSKKVTKAFATIIPPVAKTGIFEIDEEFIPKAEDVLNFNILKKVETKKVLKFTHYVKDPNDHPDFVPDIDTLLLGDANQYEDVTSEILPTLLITFLNTKDNDLEMRLLDIIMRLFNQRTELFDSLKKLEILFEPAEKKSYEFVERLSSKLKGLTEKIEVWLGNYIQGIGGHLELLETVMLIQQLTLLLDTYNYVDEDGKLVTIDKEVKNVSKSRQNIMKYIETYKPILTISKDGLHTLNRVVLDEEVNVEIKRGLVGLFSKAHFFLQQFCKGNENNQGILAEYRDIFLEYSHLDVGQIDLLCSIYSENRYLCESIPDSFLEKFISLIEVEGRQPCFLKFYKVIQKVEGSYIPENQIRVLKCLINHSEDNQEILAKTLYAVCDSALNQFNFQFETYSASDAKKDLITELEEHRFKDTYRDRPFTYHAQLLEVLTGTIKGAESFNMSKAKLKGIFSLGYLLETLSHPDSLVSSDGPNAFIENQLESAKTLDAKALNNLKGAINVFQKSTSLEKNEKNSIKEGAVLNRMEGFSIIKRKLAEFVIELYLNANTKMNEEISSNLNSFHILLEKEIRRLETLTHLTEFTQDFFDYFFGPFLSILNAYASRFLSNSKRASDFLSGRSETPFYKFLSALLNSLPLFKGKLSEKHVDNLKHFLQLCTDELEDHHKKEIDELLSEEDNQDEDFKSDRGKKNINLEQDNSNREEFWASRENWNRVMKIATQNNLNFQKALDEEKIALSKIVLRFTELFSNEDKDRYRVTLESKDIIKKLIKYLQYGFSNNAKKETMISTLQTLKKIGTNEDPKEREKLQNMLDRYDATKMFLTVLSDSSNQSMDAEILNNFLELGIQLLEGGNPRIQKNIYHYFKTFQRSEVLFSKLYSLITTHGNRIKNSNLSSEKNTTRMDNFIDELSQFGAVLLENTLRLLQLFTEGHYLEIQNYLRYQSNSRNNYDMVAAIIELLRSYLNRMDQANYESMMRCLDTLAEFVQGPCPENQMALIDGKFFDVANTLLSYSVKNSARKTQIRSLSRTETLVAPNPSKMKKKKTMEKWMIARLKYKTLVLVLSLLEMRQDRAILKRIIRSLPVEVLKKNLATVWKRYKSLYGTRYVSESLGHFEGDPRVDDQSNGANTKKYNPYDLITEIGFACYFLLENYQKVNDFDVDRDVVNEVMMKKMQSNTKKANLFEASIVGQFGSFGVSFLKQGLDIANNLKSQFNKNLLRIVAGGSKEEELKILKEIERKKLTREGMKFFAENSASIEVLRNKKPEKVYFHLHPYCSFLPKEIKNNFNDVVDRSNVQSKVTGLVQDSDEIIRIMKHEEKLNSFFNKKKVFGLFASYISLWEDLAFTLSLIVNFIILSSYSSYFGDEEDPIERRLNNPRFFLKEGATQTLSVLRILAIIMLVSSLFVVFFFMLKKMPLIITKIWQNEESEGAEQKKKPKGIIMRFFSFIAKIMKTIIQLLTTPKILYYLLYGTFAVLGVAYHPFFLTFHLTEILIRYPTLQDVVRSFWEPKKALGLTFVLFVMLEYFFTLIAYIFLYEDYVGNCDSTLDCFLYTFDYTFKANGGIGGQLVGLTDTEPGEIKLGRFFFDNIFNIVIVIVVVSIVAGIIIDTFGALREKDQEKMNDVQEKCFICGFDRETFDRKSDSRGGFVGHIKIDHYMWNYVNFIAFLKEKDPTDYTGIESYIYDKLKEGDVSWFPLNKAIVLEDIDNEEDQQEDELKYIDENILEIKKTALNLNNALKLIRKKLAFSDS